MSVVSDSLRSGGAIIAASVAKFSARSVATSKFLAKFSAALETYASALTAAK
jgi:hypothetical protein